MSTKTFRVALVTRIGIGVLAAVMYCFAAMIFGVPIAIEHSDHSGDWIVDAAAVVVLGFGVFATFASIAIARMRITVDDTTFDATLIDGHSWFLLPHFRSVRLPIQDIRSVETRSEVFRTLGLSTTRDALSIVTAAGERIGLFSNTLGSADTMPLDDVAQAIATAAGTAVTYVGTVRARGSGLFGMASSTWTEQPLDEKSAVRARRAALLTAQIGSALLVLTFILRFLL